jgi:hypothetical protein
LKRSNTGIRKQASSPSFLIIFIEGDEENGQNRLAFLIKQIREKKKNIENVPNPLVELCIVSDPNLPGASLP